MKRKWRWELRKCQRCGAEYADHQHWETIYGEPHWESPHEMCAQCRMLIDLTQRHRAEAAARDRWEKLVASQERQTERIVKGSGSRVRRDRQ